MKLVESFRALSFGGLTGRKTLPMKDGSTQAGDDALMDDKSREEEYPMLEDTVYLDHAGTTLYAKSLIDRFSKDMMANLYGNPHSASPSSQLSTQRIDDTRLKVLQFLKADPRDYDVIFVANATAATKLVMEAFRDAALTSKSPQERRNFWYGYHRDSHSSLVGVREVATAGHRCFGSDEEVDQWLSGSDSTSRDGCSSELGLFAYPAQSNLNGRRLPLTWPRRIRESRRGSHGDLYTLLDASALLSTTPLDLSQVSAAPDFTVFSFYKIFGFPDLGALVVRKDSGEILTRRLYFGGGTVDMVTCMDDAWHARKTTTLHDQLEDGTLPFHSIVALQAALDVHRQLYGSMEDVSRHTTSLSKTMYEALSNLRHGNGVSLCKIYKDPASTYGEAATQGAVVAFNVRNGRGEWIGGSEVERLASVKGFHVRTGGLCNPGGLASVLDWSSAEMRSNFDGGKRCGDDLDIIDGRVTGVIRVSLGAMSNGRDVQLFVDFLRDCYVERSQDTTTAVNGLVAKPYAVMDEGFRVASLIVYPIKSCGGWSVPAETDWQVNQEGLALDREWCLVHLGTGDVLGQKKYPRMALILPTVDLDRDMLRVSLDPALAASTGGLSEISITLKADAEDEIRGRDGSQTRSVRVCGDDCTAQMYASAEVAHFFTSALGAPCTLARFPRGGSGRSGRHAKAHLRKAGQPKQHTERPPPILLSNESPILTITRPSLDRLNDEIVASGGKMTRAAVFRPNIVLDLMDRSRSSEMAYVEDHWRSMQIGRHVFEFLGPCRRCQMICIDPDTAATDPEPLRTLHRTRRSSETSRVHFGQHTRHVSSSSSSVAEHDDDDDDDGSAKERVTIRVGDRVQAF